MIKWRSLILLIACYVGLDLANPMMPGAFNFSPEESVEGAKAQRLVFRSPAVTEAAPCPMPRGAADEPRRHARGWARTQPLAEWLVDLRQRHSCSSEPPASAEDH